MGRLGEALGVLIEPADRPGGSDEGSDSVSSQVAADPRGLTGVALLQAMFQADGESPLRLGGSGLVYSDGATTYVLEERPNSVLVLEAAKVVECMGADLATGHQASFSMIKSGYECFLGGMRAVGSTTGEAAIRAWLLYLEAQEAKSV